jgi:enoyl-CoA hydratase/carnithine racemase
MAPINPPPPTSFALLSYPAEGVVLVTYNRPEKLNCTRAADVVELTKIFQWIDEEPALRVSIITGAGDRAFSTGADLTEWQSKISAPGAQPGGAGPGDVPGAIPLSNRVGKKPVIAAVNGLALGGGCETIVNCDIVVAADSATVSFKSLPFHYFSSS